MHTGAFLFSHLHSICVNTYTCYTCSFWKWWQFQPSENGTPFKQTIHVESEIVFKENATEDTTVLTTCTWQ